MSPVAVLGGLVPADHRPHALHEPARIWAEKNCYVDAWTELLHALRLDPHACLPFVFAIDFEGDQWTFAKPPLADLRTLYGIDVQELTVWRPLLDHALEHCGAGKWLTVEVDAHWLPDTAATDYRAAHGKTTIVLNEIDADARRLGYFHNAGYFELEGADFDAVFAAPTGGLPLAPYVESIRLDRLQRRNATGLRTLSAESFREQLAWRPHDNPVLRFGERLALDLPLLQQAGLDAYHRWAFAGLRQLGAAAELAALYLVWAWPDAPPAAATEASAAYAVVAQQAKTLLLKAARAVNSGRPFDSRPLTAAMAKDWARANQAVDALVAAG